MLIMRINPERVKGGALKRGQPLYVRPEDSPRIGCQPIDCQPEDETSPVGRPAARPSGEPGGLPRLDDLDLPVLTDEDLQTWARKG